MVTGCSQLEHAITASRSSAERRDIVGHSKNIHVQETDITGLEKLRSAEIRVMRR